MEGSTIDQWIEKMLPVLDGTQTIEDLTTGLPDEYRNRVCEIAEVLYRNGFVRDVSEDRPHELTDAILNKYSAQIEFLDSLADSGGYRFQSYRQTKVLAVGSGPFFVSLVSALLESGLPKFHMLVTDSAATNLERVMELVIHARNTDPAVEVEEVPLQKVGSICWRQIIQPFDAILYVSQKGDAEELRSLHAACRAQRKSLLPAVLLQQAGMAGPLVRPDSDACWESAWRRLHRTALYKDPQLHSFSSTAGSLLANVIVFEYFKAVTGVADSGTDSRCFLLDLETLEGDWHLVKPHPLASGGWAEVEPLSGINFEDEGGLEKRNMNQLLSYFDRLTSKKTGIFHLWDEGDLKQLPLAQCKVQAADPLSEGPADLLPELICPGLTHEEARREAGLAGIEAYVSRIIGLLLPSFSAHQDTAKSMHRKQNAFVGVGAGETAAEGILRGLQKCLSEELGKRYTDRKPSSLRACLTEVKDERCRFYLRSLTIMEAEPVICLGDPLYGFPVVWIGTNGRWLGGTGLNITAALRNTLEQALLRAQNPNTSFTAQGVEASNISVEALEPKRLSIPPEGTVDGKALQRAVEILEQNGSKLLVYDLAVEPFMKEQIAGVHGVMLGEEGFR